MLPPLKSHTHPSLEHKLLENCCENAREEFSFVFFPGKKCADSPAPANAPGTAAAPGMTGSMPGMVPTVAPGTPMGIPCWFIIILRKKSIEATRGIPAAAAAAPSAAAASVAAPAAAPAAWACAAAAARFCCDPTWAMLLKNCSNSAWDGVRPNRHRLPTMSSTLAVRSIGMLETTAGSKILPASSVRFLLLFYFSGLTLPLVLLLSKLRATQNTRCPQTPRPMRRGPPTISQLTLAHSVLCVHTCESHRQEGAGEIIYRPKTKS